MTQHGLIMSAHSVNATLAGAKCQTRRVIKLPQDYPGGFYAPRHEGHKQWSFIAAGGNGSRLHLNAPYQVGDLLWVRETRWIDGGYVATDKPRRDTMGKISPLYMPKMFARLWLEVTEVRVQRVQEISDEDIYAEGFIDPPLTDREKYAFKAGGSAMISDKAGPWFIELWDSLNAKRGFSFASNPYVWAYTYKPVEKQ